MFFFKVSVGTFCLIAGIGTLIAAIQGRDDVASYSMPARLGLAGIAVFLIGIGAAHWISRIRESNEIHRLVRLQMEEERPAREQANDEHYAQRRELPDISAQLAERAEQRRRDRERDQDGEQLQLNV